MKPSPFTPLATLRLGTLLGHLLPPGVLNIGSGDDDLGALMTRHPIPRKTSFTGSVDTGRRVATASAPDLKRLTLELGGNDAAIILDDVDPADIAPKLFGSVFVNCGQACAAIKRVYAPQPIYGDLVDALAHIARSVVVGDGAAPETRLGPLSNAPQHSRVAELVTDAMRAGATVAAGGEPIDRPGHFFAPTVLAGLTDGVRIVDEEQFGPALPVLSYRDIDDAIRSANGTSFGLSGSVWSGDPDRAAAVAGQLECGTVWVNTHLAIAPTSRSQA